MICISRHKRYEVREEKSRGPRKAQLFGERSELCEAQETRCSKFTCEFGATWVT